MAGEKPKAGRGGNAASLKNLKPWKKGQSGNPSGRPKGYLSGLVQQLLKSSMPTSPDVTYGEWVVLGLIKKAGKGDAAASRLLFERSEPRGTKEPGGDR